ncbi:ferrichrome ABC transporter permease [Paenibacillus tyrfis]|uniref:FecCD family ABC transporter permease n=1 Tax=Paenibacillus TaxID=44249 RepID=UPI002490388C|nr:iron ABC transporter permease [Paenibacillus tyrfis]GLI05443.1 ferrichrome ABC transporter permease [Paenibacillus tyrfis]GMX60913.1 iron ABC transporter permease [Paenibacillus elgii]
MSVHTEAAPQSTPKLRSRPVTATIVLFAGLAVLLVGLALSVSVGAADIQLSTVWEAVFRFNPDITQHQIIQELRLPRALAGALVGACFAVAGAIMQGMTRNPLADSGLLGLNAGAGFVLALCFAFLPGLPFMKLILYSFLGAAVGAFMVYGVGSMSKNGLTPVRLALAGAAVNALLVAVSEGVAIYFNIGQDLAFWYAGGVAGTKWVQLKIMTPWVIAALIAALLLSRSITLLSLGDEVATGLGQRTGWVKLACAIVVLVLAGTAVSAVGAVGFVGLVIPHIARSLVGVDYRWIIPCSAVLGSLLMVIADIGARMINPPYETPIGTLIALIGVPFFLYLARKQRREL